METPNHLKDVVRIKAIVHKEDIIYIDGLFDAYENLAVVRTLDPHEAIIELLVSPSFVSETYELLDSLKKEAGLVIIENR